MVARVAGVDGGGLIEGREDVRRLPGEVVRGGLAWSRCVGCDHAGEEGHAVGEIADAEGFEPCYACAASIVNSRGVAVVTGSLNALTRETELADVWDDDKSPRKDTLLAGFGAVDDFAAEYYVHGSGHAASGDLGAVLLNANFLPVHEGTLPDV